MPLWLWNLITIVSAVGLGITILISSMNWSLKLHEFKNCKKNNKTICDRCREYSTGHECLKEEVFKSYKINKRICLICIPFCAIFLGLAIFGIAEAKSFKPTSYTVIDSSPIFYVTKTRMVETGKTYAKQDDGTVVETPITEEEEYKEYFYAEPITHERHTLTFDGDMAIAIGMNGETAPCLEFRKNWCGPVYQKETVLVTPMGNYAIATNEDD